MLVPEKQTTEGLTMANFTTFPIIISAATTTLLVIKLLAIFSKLVQSKKETTKQKPSNNTLLPSLPPGPAPWPLVGCAPEMISKKPTFRLIHQLMEEMNTDIACFRLGNTYVIPIKCPKIAKEILKTQDALFSSRPLSFAASTISIGYLATILTPSGMQWKKMRRVLTSEIVCPSRHEWLYTKRVEEADNLLKHVFRQCKVSDKKLVNLRIATRHYGANVIRKLVFGIRYFGEGMDDFGPNIKEQQHVDAIFSLLKYLYAFCISDYFPFLIGLDLDGHERIVNESMKTINNLHEPLISERFRQWRKNATTFIENVEEKQPKDLLDVFISLKRADGTPLLTQKEVEAQITELMLAGIDNTSNAVEWTMAELIKQPELMKKAVEEIDRVVSKERLVQESDIPNLHYISACAREAFRLHPVAPFLPTRLALSSVNVGGYYIPKGSHIMLSRMGLGRNPKVWEDPLTFKPNRYLTSGTKQVLLNDPDVRFITFGTGRRGCVAPILGTTMTIMLLARLIQGFNWTKPPDVSCINLTEAWHELVLAQPLVACAEPRLPLHIYP